MELAFLARWWGLPLVVVAEEIPLATTFDEVREQRVERAVLQPGVFLWVVFENILDGPIVVCVAVGHFL